MRSTTWIVSFWFQAGVRIASLRTQIAFDGDEAMADDAGKETILGRKGKCLKRRLYFPVYYCSGVKEL